MWYQNKNASASTCGWRVPDLEPISGLGVLDVPDRGYISFGVVDQRVRTLRFEFQKGEARDVSTIKNKKFKVRFFVTPQSLDFQGGIKRIVLLDNRGNELKLESQRLP